MKLLRKSPVAYPLPYGEIVSEKQKSIIFQLILYDWRATKAMVDGMVTKNGDGGW